MTPRPSFTCPRCTRTSHHPEDVEHGYCGACHAFTAGLSGPTLCACELGPPPAHSFDTEHCYGPIEPNPRLLRPPRQPLWPGPVDGSTVEAANRLLDHLLATDPSEHPDEPEAAIDAAECAKVRHRFAMNRYGVTCTWEQLTDDERGAATIETWTWLSAVRAIGIVR